MIKFIVNKRSSHLRKKKQSRKIPLKTIPSVLQYDQGKLFLSKNCIKLFRKIYRIQLLYVTNIICKLIVKVFDREKLFLHQNWLNETRPTKTRQNQDFVLKKLQKDPRKILENFQKISRQIIIEKHSTTELKNLKRIKRIWRSWFEYGIRQQFAQTRLRSHKTSLQVHHIQVSKCTTFLI